MTSCRPRAPAVSLFCVCHVLSSLLSVIQGRLGSDGRCTGTEPVLASQMFHSVSLGRFHFLILTPHSFLSPPCKLMSRFTKASAFAFLTFTTVHFMVLVGLSHLLHHTTTSRPLCPLAHLHSPRVLPLLAKLGPVTLHQHSRHPHRRFGRV
jgi:hypothetical protein